MILKYIQSHANIFKLISKVLMLIAVVSVSWYSRDGFYESEKHRNVSVEYIANRGNPWGVSFRELEIDGVSQKLSDQELEGFSVNRKGAMLTQISSFEDRAKIIFRDPRVKDIKMIMNITIEDSQLVVREDDEIHEIINFTKEDVGDNLVNIKLPRVLELGWKNILFYISILGSALILLLSIVLKHDEEIKTIITRIIISITLFVIGMLVHSFYKETPLINSGETNEIGKGIVIMSGWFYIFDFTYSFIQNISTSRGYQLVLKNISTLIVVIGMPLMIIWGVQNLFSNMIEFDQNYIVWNSIIIIGFLIGLGFLVGYKSSISLIIVFAIVFGIANRLMIEYRDMPVLSYHLGQLETLGTVGSNFDWSVSEQVVQTAIMMILMGLMFTRVVSITPKFSTRVKRMIVGAVILVAHWGIIVPHVVEVSAVPLDYFRMQTTYSDYGGLLSYFSFHHTSKLKPPLGRKTEKVASDILEQNIVENKKNGELPDIIFIQSESQADFVQTASVDVKDPLEYQKSLYDQAISGDLYVSVFGGGTANTEYEVLTSLSLSNSLKGYFPYQTLVQPESYSFVSYLNSLGYDTVGMHPYPEKNYNRKSVYDHLGFDETYFFTDGVNSFKSLVDVEYERYDYMSDESLYKAITNYTDSNRDKSKFVFAVTMQGHGPYSDTEYPIDPAYKNAEGFGLNESVYFTSLNRTDKALKELINHYKKSSKPTVIVIYGDHQPKLSEEFYKAYFDEEDKLQKYQAPFMIWANYDLKSQENEQISANFLVPHLISTLEDTEYALPVTPYYEYLIKLQSEIQVMTSEGYLMQSGKWETDVPEEQMNEIKAIEYNTIYSSSEKDKYYLPIEINDRNDLWKTNQ